MRAAEVRRSQVARAAELERTKARNQAEMLRGRLRTSAAGRGVGAGGSVQLLEQQIDFDLGLRNAVENANESNFQAAIGSDMSARLASLLSENPLMASFVGGLQGASTGLAITGAADELDLLPKRIP